MPLQERILKSSIKIPTRPPPAATTRPPPARPCSPPARRASVLNKTPSIQQHPSPKQHPVFNSIRPQHNTQCSTASRCKRNPLGLALKTRPARRPPPAARPPAARPPARRPPPCVHVQDNTQYSTASVSNTTPSTQQYGLQHSTQYSTACRCKGESLGVLLKSRPARRPPARRPAVLPCSTQHQVLNCIRLQHIHQYSTASVSNTASSTQQHPAARENL